MKRRLKEELSLSLGDFRHVFLLAREANVCVYVQSKMRSEDVR
jgi:hypothetical protein